MRHSTSDKHSKLLFALVVLVCLSAFTIDLCIPVLPVLSDEFGIAKGKTHLVMTAYLLSYALTQILCGRLADDVGRVKTLYLGLIIYLIGSLITSFSTDFTTLLIGRFIQGAGGAAGPVVSRAIAADVFEGKRLTKVLSMLVTALAVSTIFAPLFGSVLISLFGWRSVFIATIFFAALSLLLVYLFVPETLDKAEAHLKTSLAVGLHQFFTHPRALHGSMILAGCFVAFMTSLASFASIATDHYNISAANTGYYFTGFIAFYLFSATITQRSSHHRTEDKSLAIGIGILLSCFLVLAYSLSRDDYSSIFALMLFYLGFGIVFPSGSAIVMKSLTSIAGTASGILGTLQVLAGTLGTLLSSFFYIGTPDSTTVIMMGAIIWVAIWFILAKQRKVF